MLPLEGLRVLDFTQGVAGPYCAMLLGDFGAEVIKVEQPRGDWQRPLGHMVDPERGSSFICLNRNKRGMVVDLTRPAGAALVRELAAKVDILTENFRPGALAQYGLGYEAVRATNRGIIYVSINGYGWRNPLVNAPASDTVMQAFSGLMSVTGPPETPMRVGVPGTDMLGGGNAFSGVLLALLRRQQTGEGAWVKTSLLRSSLVFQSMQVAEYLTTGQQPARVGNTHHALSPAGTYPAQDGFVNLVTLTEAQWAKLCRALDREEWLADSRFTTNADRMRHQAAINALVAERLAGLTRAEIVERLRAAGVLASPVNEYRDLLGDPALAADLLIDQADPVLGQARSAANPLTLDDEEPAARRPAPRLGEHTRELLLEAGYSEEQIGAWLAEGVVIQH